MTRFGKILAAALPLVAATCAFGEITGSKHDFTAMNWADNAICKPCHTPHNAVATDITGRLWAHEMSPASTVYQYHGTRITPADGVTTGDAYNGSLTVNDLDGATRLCMSCHDGTVALDSFKGRNAPTSDGKAIGADADHGRADANLGTNLSDDHPVGYKAMYKENSGLTFTVDAGTGAVTIGGHARYKPLATAKAAGLRFANSMDATAVITANTQRDQAGAFITYTRWPSVSCVSCHDVHDGTLGHGGPGERGLLRVTNTGSAICLACHNK